MTDIKNIKEIDPIIEFLKSRNEEFDIKINYDKIEDLKNSAGHYLFNIKFSKYNYYKDAGNIDNNREAEKDLEELASEIIQILKKYDYECIVVENKILVRIKKE